MAKKKELYVVFRICGGVFCDDSLVALPPEEAVKKGLKMLEEYKPPKGCIDEAWLEWYEESEKDIKNLTGTSLSGDDDLVICPVKIG